MSCQFSFKKQNVNNKKFMVMIKKLFLVLFLSFVVVGNIDAQKHKRTMKPKKKEQIEQPYCAEPAFDPCNDTLNVDTLGAKMFETVEGLKPSFPGDLFKFIAAHLQYPPELAECSVSGRVGNKVLCDPFWSLLSVQGYAFCRPIFG